MKVSAHASSAASRLRSATKQTCWISGMYHATRLSQAVRSPRTALSRRRACRAPNGVRCGCGPSGASCDESGRLSSGVPRHVPLPIRLPIGRRLPIAGRSHPPHLRPFSKSTGLITSWIAIGVPRLDPVPIRVPIGPGLPLAGRSDGPHVCLTSTSTNLVTSWIATGVPSQVARATTSPTADRGCLLTQVHPRRPRQIVSSNRTKPTGRSGSMSR
jgi:hypothetical protein